MHKKITHLPMISAFLFFFSLPLGSADIDFYSQTETSLINYYSSPKNFQEAQSNDPNPLLLSVDRGFDRLVRLLIDLGTNVNLQNRYGISPLLWSVNKNNGIITQILLAYNASPSIPDNRGWTPLMLSAKNNNLPITRMLIEAGADVNASNFEGSTPLLWASRNSSLPLVEYLLSEGADIEHRNLKNQTAAHIAARYGQQDVLLLLLKKDPCLAFTRDSEGNTPLLKAVKHRHYRIIDILIPYELKGNPDNPLSSALSLAKSQDNTEMEDYLENFLRKPIERKGIKPLPALTNTTNTHSTKEKIKEFKSLSSIPEDVRKRILTFLGILDATTVRSVHAKKQTDTSGDLWSGTISYFQNNQTRSQNFNLKIRKP